MQDIVKAKIEDISKLKEVIIEWQNTCNGKVFGIKVNIKNHISDLLELIEDENADLFLLLKKDMVIGYMGVTCFNSPLGEQKIANEHYWFVSGNNRGRGTMQLLKAIKEWAKDKGCSHLIMNCSNLASEMHDRLCTFYEKIGFKKFETSFIKEL